MKKSLQTLSYLAVLAIPLFIANPVLAQSAAPQPAQPGMAGPHCAEHEGHMGMECGCPMMMEHDMQKPGMMGQGMGQGMMGQGMMEHDMMPPEMMKPSRHETPEMTQLRQEMIAQHQKLMADRTQMRADCQKMHELFHRMKELHHKRHMGPKSPTTKGNAAPQNPAMDGKTSPSKP